MTGVGRTFISLSGMSAVFFHTYGAVISYLSKSEMMMVRTVDWIPLACLLSSPVSRIRGQYSISRDRNVAHQ